MFVRYEDISQDPLKMATKIYNFIGHRLPTELKKWILSTNNTTNPSPDKKTKIDPYSTNRNSTYTMMKWRLENSFTAVRGVQEMCKDALRLAGYKEIHSVQELENLEIPVLEKFSFD